MKIFYASKILYILLFLISFSSCKKTSDIVSSDIELDNSSISERFFKIPKGTDEPIGRVIDYLKIKNSTNNFADNFSQTVGYPVWNKVIYRNNNKSVNRSNAESGSADSLVFIPLVLENGNTVNGYILVKFSDSLTVSYRLASDYKAYPFYENDKYLTASQFTYDLLLLNKLVFGIEDYKITDARLFSKDTLTRKTKKVSLKKLPNNFNRQYTVCDVITWGGWICTTPNSQLCKPECDHCGGTTCYPWEEAVEICYSVPGGGGGGSGGDIPPPPGNEGGGGEEGGGLPHDYPCLPDLPDLPGHRRPPTECLPPGGGTGWEPDIDLSLDLKNPCGVIDSLLKLSFFSDHLKKLRDSTILDYERGYSFTSPFNATNLKVLSYAKSGDNDKLAVNIRLTSPTNGIMHNHYNDPQRLHNFSAEDIYKLAYFWSKGQINGFKDFTYTVVTDSTAYIMMVTDSVKFINFAQTWMNSQDNLDNFRTHLYSNHYYGESGNTILQDEMFFLNALQAPPINGAGLKLFRGSADMKAFTPIKVAANGKVVTAPCN